MMDFRFWKTDKTGEKRTHKVKRINLGGLKESDFLPKPYVQFTFTGKHWFAWKNDKILLVGDLTSCMKWIENFVQTLNSYDDPESFNKDYFHQVEGYPEKPAKNPMVSRDKKIPDNFE